MIDLCSYCPCVAACFCHDFTRNCYKRARSPFSLALERADRFLFEQGLHPAFGIVRGGKVVAWTPEQFVATLCARGLPRPLVVNRELLAPRGDEVSPSYHLGRTLTTLP